MMATVKLDHRGNEWGLKREAGVAPYQSTDPDTLRIWWSDVGVHQNLTFPVYLGIRSPACIAGIRLFV